MYVRATLDPIYGCLIASLSLLRWQSLAHVVALAKCQDIVFTAHFLFFEKATTPL